MTHRYHNSFDPACKTPFGAVEAGQKVTLRLFVPAGESCTDPTVQMFEADRWHIPAASFGMVRCRMASATLSPASASLSTYRAKPASRSGVKSGA